MLDYKKDTSQDATQAPRQVDAQLYLTQAQPQPQPGTPPSAPEPPIAANDNVFRPTPPPEAPPLTVPFLPALGRGAIWGAVLSLGGDTPMPTPTVTLLPNADATEAGLFDQAHKSFVPDTSPGAFAHDQDVEKWCDHQKAAYQVHKKQTRNNPQAAPRPNSAVRPSPSATKLKRYNLNRFLQNKRADKRSYYVKKYCR